MDVNDFPLWTALITPMQESGEVDFISLEKLVKVQEKAKNGILILGSTGESLNLNDGEKKDILEFVIGLKPKVPLMCGVGGINLEHTKNWVKYLEAFDLDAYLLVTPLYAKPGPKGQSHWFKTLMDISSKPCLLYNVPSRTGVSLSLETVKELKDHPQYWGLKEASGSADEFERFVHAGGPGKKNFCGDDALFPEFAKLGSCGLISVASNVWPSETHEYVNLCLKGQFEDHDLWAQASKVLFLASNPVPAKALAHHQGFIKGPHVRAPLSHTDLEDIEPILMADEKVEEWGKKFNT
jgi:4-hydroxy-tetrahydrodipicolinate synthase